MAVVGINAGRAYNGLVGRLEADLISETRRAADEIALRNRSNLALVRMIALAQESGQFGRRAETLQNLERVLKANPDVYAAYVTYEPNADGNDAVGATAGVPVEALGDGGRFDPYLKRDPRAPGGFILETLQDTEEDGDLWYRLPKERFERAGVSEGIVTKPYTYLGTDIIEYVTPIIRDGRFLGVAGLDVALTDVQARARSLATALDADIFIETRGAFLTATTDEGVAADKRLRTTEVARSALAPLFANAAAGDVSLRTGIDPESGEPCYFVATSIGDEGWRLVVRKPTKAIGAEVWRLVALNLLTAVVGLAILITILSVGAMRLARRVQAAKKAAEAK